MKKSFYFLLILIAYFANSCYNYSYVTKKFNDVYYLTYKEKANFKEYEYSIVDTLKDGNYHVREFTKDSVILYDYYRNSKFVYIGEYKNYYSNGKIKKLVNYNKKGEYNGELKTFFENGNKKRHDYYSNDKLDSGICWDINGKQLEHFDFSQNPSVDMKLISKSLVYPENLRRMEISEKVEILLFLDSIGIPLKFKYDKYNSIEFVSEIARIIMKPDMFKPATLDGIPSKCWVVIPVNFKLIP